MASQRTRARRGFSIIETLVAGVIMMLGLTGVMLMLAKTMGNGRTGGTTVSGSMLANQTIQEMSALGYDGLTPLPAGTDAGMFKDLDGRLYGRTVQVTAMTTDAGWPAYRVDVAVSWRDMNFTSNPYNPPRSSATTIITRAPDAG